MKHEVYKIQFPTLKDKYYIDRGVYYMSSVSNMYTNKIEAEEYNNITEAKEEIKDMIMGVSESQIYEYTPSSVENRRRARILKLLRSAIVVKFVKKLIEIERYKVKLN